MSSTILLCRARYLLPLAAPDRTLRIQDGYVLADGETLLEVGPYTPEVGRRILAEHGDRLEVVAGRLAHPGRPHPASAEDPIPCLHGVLLPAFVKAHGHDHEQPLIGIAKDEPLTAWLDHAVNPYTGFISRNRDDLTQKLGMSPQLVTYLMARICDIHYGITASMVHHCNHNKYHLEDIARANEVAGTTMIVAVGGQDRFYTPELIDRPQDALDRMARALSIQAGCARTTFIPGPDQCFSNSRAMLVPLKTWARDHGTLFHIHSAEEPKTTAWFQAEIEPGRTPVQYFDDIGVLDADTIVAHQVNCGPEDVGILARTGTSVAHNPLANTILGSGMPPVVEMIRAGISVAISTDGSGSADNQNILAAARLAAQYQKALHKDASLLPAQDLLERITSVPNRMLRMNQGELAPGRQADWVVLGLNRPNMVPTRLDNVVENLLWAADGSEVETVVSRGRILKHEGEVRPFLDGTVPEEIMDKVQQLSEWFMAQRVLVSGTGANR